jgi:uncharacterized protein YuzE
MYFEEVVPLDCTYDTDADAAYLYLVSPIADGAVQRTITVDTDHGMINLDLDGDGRLIGVEVLGADRHLPPALRQAIAGGNR